MLLVLTARDMSKVQAVTQELNANYPDVKTRTLQLDVASFKSITSAAAEVNGYAELNLNILINNAGVMNIPERVLSPDGFEMHLATNYLGPFLFTNSIMGKLLNSPGGRTVNITSNGHALSPFQFKDYNFEGKPLPESEKLNKELCKGWSLSWGLGYLPAIAYGQSKTAMILYTVQLSKLLNSKGLSAVCVYPGGNYDAPADHLTERSLQPL